MQELKEIEIQLNKAPDKQISQTDPDARSMKTRGTGIVGYNVQTAVDRRTAGRFGRARPSGPLRAVELQGRIVRIIDGDILFLLDGSRGRAPAQAGEHRRVREGSGLRRPHGNNRRDGDPTS